jgi:aldehyde:ferredoxin oxidoreductase
MTGGYMGKILFVDLSTHTIREEVPEERFYRDYIGGNGIGAKVLYDRQKAGVDPLGPENTFGIITGPLTGTPVPFGTRYVAVAKSPLTGGWGDANSGGHFGPYFKFAGYDAVFFTGISEKPVYLLADNGKAELRDASNYWGKSTYETEDGLKAEFGEAAEVISIGPAGEKLSLISCIMTRRGDAAGRSGLGAVMGSKKLKAIVARGSKNVELADSETTYNLRKEHLDALKKAKMRDQPIIERFHKYGTSDDAIASSRSGDSPVKNWGGVGIVDFPDVAGLSGDLLIANLQKREGCWHCPFQCKARMKEGTGEYKYPAGAARIEYETQAAFGAMCLVNNAEALNMANHICNSYGMDTISAGTIIAFAMECYENGLITKKDTDGIELNWGNHRAMVAMTEKMAKREGFGDILADGVKAAAKRIGKGANKYAVHIGGQELGMHDPKCAGFGPTPAARYQMDATPGRHTTGFGPPHLGRVTSASGLCSFGFFGVPNMPKLVNGYMRAVTGWEIAPGELDKTGERITLLRHSFNLREGINPLKLKVHPRIVAAQKEGPLAGVKADIKAQALWQLGALGWDRITTKPSKMKLLELGLDNVAKDLWP